MGSSAFSWLFGGGGGRSGGGVVPAEEKERNKNEKEKADKTKKKRGGGATPKEEQEQEEEELGVTEQLREFVRGFNANTFRDFPLPAKGDQASSTADEGSHATHPNNSGGSVKMYLTEWQKRHATLMLSTVKEMSQLRYVLCPRHLKEEQFWRIYFLLVKNYVAPYEIRAIQKAKLKMMELECEKSMDKGTVEVEMTEAKQVKSVSSLVDGLDSKSLPDIDGRTGEKQNVVERQTEDSVLK